MVLVGNSILLFFSSLMSGLVLHFSPRIRNSVSGSPSTRQQPDMNDSLTKAVKDFSSVKGVFTWVFSENCQSYREISLTALFLTMRYGMMVLMVSPWRPLYCTVLYCTVLYCMVCVAEDVAGDWDTLVPDLISSSRSAGAEASRVARLNTIYTQHIYHLDILSRSTKLK